MNNIIEISLRERLQLEREIAVKKSGELRNVKRKLKEFLNKLEAGYLLKNDVMVKEYISKIRRLSEEV